MAGGIQYVNLRIRNRSSDRDSSSGGFYLAGSRPDRGLRWTIHVPKRHATLKKVAGKIGRQRFTAAKYLQAVSFTPTSIDQHAPGRGSCLHHSCARIRYPVFQGKTIGSSFSAHE